MSVTAEEIRFTIKTYPTPISGEYRIFSIELGFFSKNQGRNERKKILNKMFTMIPASFIVMNFTGLLLIRKRAKGMAVKASIPRIIANQVMYSG